MFVFSFLNQQFVKSSPEIKVLIVEALKNFDRTLTETWDWDETTLVAIWQWLQAEFKKVQKTINTIFLNYFFVTFQQAHFFK